jgi:hypothetical protein
MLAGLGQLIPARSATFRSFTRGYRGSDLAWSVRFERSFASLWYGLSIGIFRRLHRFASIFYTQPMACGTRASRASAIDLP